jgi:hypothetical protein
MKTAALPSAYSPPSPSASGLDSQFPKPLKFESPAARAADALQALVLSSGASTPPQPAPSPRLATTAIAQPTLTLAPVTQGRSCEFRGPG